MHVWGGGEKGDRKRANPEEGSAEKDGLGGRKGPASHSSEGKANGGAAQEDLGG